METFPIGTKVFYFEDAVRGSREIKESVVYGAFIARKTGDLFYFLKEKQIPAYCVAATREQAEEMVAKFDAYCTDYAANIDKQNAKYTEFKADFCFEEMKDENVEE